MNGFQSGNFTKSVSTDQTSSGEALISILLANSFLRNITHTAFSWSANLSISYFVCTLYFAALPAFFFIISGQRVIDKALRDSFLLAKLPSKKDTPMLDFSCVAYSDGVGEYLLK
jgi:hypothetical protein